MPSHVIKPELLPARTLYLYYLLLPVLITVFVSGLVGVFILQDQQLEYSISKTYLAETYRKLIAFNPIISALLVNVPVLGLLYVGLRLQGHRAVSSKAHGIGAANWRAKHTKNL